MIMSRLKAGLAAATILFGLSAPPAFAKVEAYVEVEVDHGGSNSFTDVVESWEQDAETDRVAASGLADFRQLTSDEQNRFFDLLHDPETWQNAAKTASSVSTAGTHQVVPDVEVVLHAPLQEKSAAAQEIAGSDNVPLNLWNGTAKSTIDFKIFGVKLGHWAQEYGYTTRTGQYSIVSSDWCKGWWSGFAGFWNVSSSTNHYKSGSFGYCKTLHTGSVVFEGSFIQVNKEHGQKVAGPSASITG